MGPQHVGGTLCLGGVNLRGGRYAPPKLLAALHVAALA